jgi:hypothetical protein
VSKIIAFACLALAMGLCLWLAPWRSLIADAQPLGPALLAAGGLFSIAIAVMIRD